MQSTRKALWSSTSTRLAPWGLEGTLQLHCCWRWKQGWTLPKAGCREVGRAAGGGGSLGFGDSRGGTIKKALLGERSRESSETPRGKCWRECVPKRGRSRIKTPSEGPGGAHRQSGRRRLPAAACSSAPEILTLLSTPQAPQTWALVISTGQRLLGTWHCAGRGHQGVIRFMETLLSGS